jgi:hypothetical protein
MARAVWLPSRSDVGSHGGPRPEDAWRWGETPCAGPEARLRDGYLSLGHADTAAGRRHPDELASGPVPRTGEA